MHTRQAVFNFTNATQLVIEWPSAPPEGAAVSEGELHRALAAPQFHAQVGGKDKEPGHLYVVPGIEVPTQLTEEERRLWENLKKGSRFKPGLGR